MCIWEPVRVRGTLTDKGGNVILDPRGGREKELLCPTALMCCMAQVREALASKVSRERFGSEMKGCLDGAPFDTD